ncbi:hypothetical protein RUM44_008711 [Polyplax serrata]|uniref:CD80-like immunoglobulin C2-set domain-containing protein n=1 Tax=Polyplax serrata TaxID=468196 RepID=A0ABR1BD92_POLSC
MSAKSAKGKRKQMFFARYRSEELEEHSTSAGQVSPVIRDDITGVKVSAMYLPKDGPHITGEEKEYQVGNEILLNCTSGKSFPASTLHWYINDNQISNPDDLLRYPTVVHPHGLLTTALGLRLHVTNNHFEDGQMRVKCVASVSPVLWQGNRESVVQRVAPLIDNREAHFLVRGGAATGCSLGLSVGYFTVSVLLFHRSMR